MNPVVLTEADAGSVRAVQPGDNVVLSLPETPSTGYRWSIDVSHPDVASVEPGRRGATAGGIGARGTREFPIRGTGKGTVMLNAKLWRDWEGENSTIKRLSFTLNFK
jgi:inhibitor of cysteine peptidase